MRSHSLKLVALSLASVVRGDLHHLLVGTFGTEALYTVEFDDTALTLNLLKNTTTESASSWLALSVSLDHSTMKKLILNINIA